MKHVAQLSFKMLCCMMLPVMSLAAENKVEKMSSDQTQQQYQRKSITYLGYYLDRGVHIPVEELLSLERIIRQKIELPRFDYNQVELADFYSVEEFVGELREYVKQCAVDRASAEAEYESRFKRAKVTMQDIDRIMRSTYFYQIRVVKYLNRSATCPDSKIEALTWGCMPGTEGMLVTLNTIVDFYKVNLLDETQPPYQLLRSVGNDSVKGFAGMPKEIAHEDRTREEASARQDALNSAAGNMAEILSKGTKQIPEFQLLSPVTAVLADGVEFMLGSDQGVQMDDTYDVVEYGAAGDKSLLGYIKVRRIGTAKGTGEGTPSTGENVKVKRRFVGGEQLFEHPMIGVSVGLSFVTEFVLQDVLTRPDDEKKSAIYPGIGFVADIDLARFIKVPELYLSVEGDMLFLPNDYDINTYLAHGMLGIKKKWYLESLVFSLGARFGISYFIIEDYEDEVVGYGGDVWLGVEYYVVPEFSLYLRAAGRYFTNPLSYDYGDEFDPELGVNATVGAFVAF